MTSTAILALRPAHADDAADVARLAALDSAAPPAGPVLLGVVDGRAVAALSLSSGALVADPFTPTADVVTLLRQRAALLAPTAAPGRRRPFLPGRRGRGPALA